MIALLAIMAMVAGTGIKAYSAYKEGIAKSKAEESNARLLDIQAQQTKEAGKIEDAKLKREKRMMLARQKSRYAQAGVRFDEGSPLDVLADSESEFDKDILYNKVNTGNQASYYTSSADQRRKMSKSYKNTGILNTASHLISGTSQVASFGASQ